MSTYTYYDDVIIPPDGNVLLKDKQNPICELLDPSHYHPHYVYTRGYIDVKSFKKQLQSLPASVWEDENQDGNVQITRPSHDAWGIKKIIFTFCDDFLLKILDLPWSQLPQWKEFLHSVYEAIGIQECQVVRCLLASMPPGVVIPVHHDTGSWVKHTHRCHLAIITGPEVEFKVGPTSDLMSKYLFDEGRIVELNNQAKHAVVNNMSDTHRVHLIFDYVDDVSIIKQRVLLNPGEVVVQTRRSIDLVREEAKEQKKMIPAFIIIGAQKCGTTSMYEYICQHALVAKGKRRETHYFDWRFNTQLPPPVLCKQATATATVGVLVEGNIPQSEVYMIPANKAHLDYYSNFFYVEQLNKHISLITGESTPSYLLHSDIVIPRMLAICPWVKLLVMLRNPVARAYSQYQMCIDPNGTPQVRGESAYKDKTFKQIILEEIELLTHYHITPSSDDTNTDISTINTLTSNNNNVHIMTNNHIDENDNIVYQNFCQHILSKVPLTHGGHSIVARGLYALQLQAWMKHWPKNQLEIYAIEEIIGTKQHIQATMDRVFTYLDLPSQDILDVEAKNTRNYDPIPPDCKVILEDFYRPFNQQLYKLLGRDFKWD